MATITLSTLDTNAPREYHRYALIFGCPDEAVTSTRKALHEVIKKTVAELPVLAGNVSTGEDGKTEIHVTHQQIEQYKAKVVNTTISHADLCREKIAPRLLFRESMTPLADRPAQGSAPASAFQANFLANGLVLVIYLHRQVADIHGIGTILRLMSEGLPERQLTEEDLILECAQASFHRENLSSSEGATPRLARNRLGQQKQQFVSGRQASAQQQIAQQQLQQHHITTGQGQHTVGQTQPTRFTNNIASVVQSANTASAVFSFKLEHIEITRSLVNARRETKNINGHVDDEHVLLAIVWKMIIRAKYPHGSIPGKDKTSLAVPIDIRKVLDPPMDSSFFGNAQITAYPTWDITELGIDYDVDRIYNASCAILAAINKTASDLQVRSQIAFFNSPFENMTLDAEAAGDANSNNNDSIKAGNTVNTRTDISDIINPPADYKVYSFSATYPSAKDSSGSKLTPASTNPIGSGGGNKVVGGQTAPIPIPGAAAKGKGPATDKSDDSDSDTITGPIVDLGLGLGNADAVRRVGRTVASNEVIILPLDRARKAWEVQVELEAEVLNKIYQDESLMEKVANLYELRHVVEIIR